MLMLSCRKSTKFFFSHYKTRNSTSANDKIQILGHNQANSPVDKLQYMKNIYQDIYKAENNSGILRPRFTAAFTAPEPKAKSSNNWLWKITQIKLCDQLGDQFKVRKATEFLR
ncbi:25105_t:CDS:2, partial [Gigaspora rosea]